MTTTKQQEKLREAIQGYMVNDNYIFPLRDIAVIEGVLKHLESEELIPYSVSYREDSGDGYWLQQDYHSDKLGKTVIWDYDFPKYFEDMDDIIRFIIRTSEEITKFETLLPYITK